MFGYIKGRITHKTPAFIYLEAAGVGYHINISLSTFGKLEGLQEASIFTHLHVREDDMSLYGFLKKKSGSFCTIDFRKWHWLQHGKSDFILYDPRMS